jgi:hypothetical protein
VAPGHDYTDQLLGDLPLGKEHLENLMLKYLLELVAHNDESNPESACAYESAIRAQNVTVGVESDKIPKSLDGDYSA